jgi:hypothetical protein
MVNTCPIRVRGREWNPKAESSDIIANWGYDLKPEHDIRRISKRNRIRE